MHFTPTYMKHTRGRELDGTETFSASFNSDAFAIAYAKYYAISVVATSASSLDVDIELQASVDGSTWTDIEDSQDSTLTADGSVLFLVTDASYPLVRVKFTINTGSCKFAVKISGKE